jgi:hypothetical protein
LAVFGFTNEERKTARRLRQTVPPAQAGGGFQRHQLMPGTGPGPARCLHSHSHNNGFVLPRRTSGEPVSPRNFSSCASPCRRRQINLLFRSVVRNYFPGDPTSVVCWTQRNRHFNSDMQSRYSNEIKTTATPAASFRQRQQSETFFSILLFILLTTYYVVIIRDRLELSTVFFVFSKCLPRP